jgi:hypothetical protein
MLSTSIEFHLVYSQAFNMFEPVLALNFFFSVVTYNRSVPFLASNMFVCPPLSNITRPFYANNYYLLDIMSNYASSKSILHYFLNIKIILQHFLFLNFFYNIYFPLLAEYQEMLAFVYHCLAVVQFFYCDHHYSKTLCGATKAKSFFPNLAASL